MNATPYQIANDAENLTGRANTAYINRRFRQQDDSHLWPVCNRFNATERAIRAVRRRFAETGDPCEGLAYALAVDAELSRIVNAP